MGNSGGGGGSGSYGSNYGSHSTPGDHHSSGYSSSAMTPATVPTYSSSFGSCSATTSWGSSQVGKEGSDSSWGQTPYVDNGPSQKCIDAQQTANSLCDNVGNTPLGGYAAAGDHISQGLRCTAAQDYADKVCGK